MSLNNLSATRPAPLRAPRSTLHAPRCTLHAPSPSRLTPLLALFLTLQPPFKSTAAPATGQRGAASTVHPLATEAAIQAMKNGGNAIDAAVAAGLTLGVV